MSLLSSLLNFGRYGAFWIGQVPVVQSLLAMLMEVV